MECFNHLFQHFFVACLDLKLIWTIEEEHLWKAMCNNLICKKKKHIYWFTKVSTIAKTVINLEIWVCIWSPNANWMRFSIHQFSNLICVALYHEKLLQLPFSQLQNKQNSFWIQVSWLPLLQTWIVQVADT